MTGETTYVHLEPELYYTIHNRAFDIAADFTYEHNDRLELADTIVNLVREYAPVIMAHAQTQARAEAAIVPAVLKMWQEGKL